MTPDEIAKRCAAIMGQADQAAKWLGVELKNIAPGSCEMTLTIKNHHLNGHGVCHGGFITTLADTCFAYACNSYNKNALASDISVTFLSPGRIDEVLTATTKEITVIGRTGIYDVEVRGDDGRLIAIFRGRSRQIRGQHFEEQP